VESNLARKIVGTCGEETAHFAAHVTHQSQKGTVAIELPGFITRTTSRGDFSLEAQLGLCHSKLIVPMAIIMGARDPISNPGYFYGSRTIEGVGTCLAWVAVKELVAANEQRRSWSWS
jgi:hypothetical protein